MVAINERQRRAAASLPALPGRLLTSAACAIAAAPALAVLSSLLTPPGDTMRHVLSTTAPSYAIGTLFLCVGVGILAGAIGVASAALIALCRFPFRGALSLALALPLAVPAYISAYAYADLLGPFGALAPFARAAAAIGLPDIRSLPGAVFVLSLTLYPYAYLAARAAFASRSAAILETARTLGASPMRATTKLLIPATRPAIAGALALIMMETAAEFGVADYFGVPTLSVGIFRTWYSFGDLGAASHLASGLFLFAVALVALEAIGRRGLAADTPRVTASDAALDLKGAARFIAPAFCFLIVLLGFLAPVIAIGAKLDFTAYSTRGLWSAFQNSLSIALAGGAVTLLVAIALSYVSRTATGPIQKAAIRFATLGYAIPGAVIAIGVLAVFAFISEATGVRIWAAAGPVALIYAYGVRFLTAGYNTVSGGLAQIHRGLDEAARSLGATSGKIIADVHAPMLRKSLAAALIIIMVDIAKELPATLILRDFNFETLATRVYRLAGDERLAEAAPDALMLIGLGALPVLLLLIFSERK